MKCVSFFSLITLRTLYIRFIYSRAASAAVLFEELESVKWYIVGLGEVRRTCEA